METSTAGPRTAPAAGYRFGAFRFERAPRRLLRADRLIPLQPQPARALELLLARAGQLVSRDALKEQMWGTETFVDRDQGINFAMCKIRTALGDDASAPRFLETVPRAGYRFVAPVELLVESSFGTAEPPPEAPSSPEVAPPVVATDPIDGSARVTERALAEDPEPRDRPTAAALSSSRASGMRSGTRPKAGASSRHDILRHDVSATLSAGPTGVLVDRPTVAAGDGASQLLMQGTLDARRTLKPPHTDRSSFADLETRPLPSVSTSGSSLARPWSLRRRRSAFSALLLLLLLTVGLVLAVERSHHTQDGRNRIAVAPFTTVGLGSIDDEVLAESLRTEIAEAVAHQVGGALQVLAPSSNGGDLPSVAVAKSFGPHLTLDGEVGRLEDRLLLTLRLRNAEGALLWAHPFEPALDAVSTLPSDAARRLRGALGLPHRNGGGEPPSDQALEGATAIEFLIGRQMALEGAPERIAAGMERLEAVARAAPNSPRAWSALAAGHARRAALGEPVETDTITELAQRSLELDPGQAEAHLQLASLAFYQRYDWALTRHHLEAALANQPGSPQVLRFQALLAAAERRTNDATHYARRAAAVDPLGVETRRAQLQVDLLAGRFDQVVEDARATLDLYPYDRGSREALVRALLELGRRDEAWRLLQRAFEAGGQPAPVDLDAALDRLRRAWESAEGPRPLELTRRAAWAAYAGDSAAAWALLTEACSVPGDRLLPFAAVDPAFATLRDRPGWNRRMSCLPATTPPNG